jgi:hypothetical protein
MHAIDVLRRQLLSCNRFAVTSSFIAHTDLCRVSLLPMPKLQLIAIAGLVGFLFLPIIGLA